MAANGKPVGFFRLRAPDLIFLGLIVLIVLPMLFNQFGNPALSYPEQPFAADGDLRQGGTVRVSAVRCNSDRETIDFNYVSAFINLDTDERFSNPDGWSFTDPGCTRSVGRFKIPADITPGRYQIVGASSITNRWGRTQDVIWRTLEFPIAVGTP